METNKSVQNQKVFVELISVLDLQDLYRTVSSRSASSSPPKDAEYRRGERDGLRQAIELLGLPIRSF